MGGEPEAATTESTGGATGDAVLATTAAADGGGAQDELERDLSEELERDLMAVGQSWGQRDDRPSRQAHTRRRDRVAGDAQPAALAAQGDEAEAADAAVPAPVKKKRRQKGRGSAAYRSRR